MKRKKQIEYFLKNRRYRTRIDFDLVSSYCRTKFGLKLHEPSYFENDSGMTSAIFQKWLEDGFGGGDVVKRGDILYLVQSSSPGDTKMCFKIENGIPSRCSDVLPDDSLVHANKEETKRIFNALDNMGLEFENPYFCVTDQYKPSSGDLVSFVNKKTGDEGIGVVRMRYMDGKITMFCYVLKGMDPKYSMEEYLGYVNDFRFTPFSPADYPRKYLEAALNKVGKTWNHSLKRIEPLNMEREKGESYWFISDKRTVMQAEEKKTVVSHKRYLSGNYFRTREEAMEVLAEQNEVVRRILARPEK